MYRLSKEQQWLQDTVFANTPIDTIISSYDLPNGIEVTGRAGGDTLTYRIYKDGSVVEK